MSEIDDLMDEFMEIADEALSKADNIECLLKEHLAGLKVMLETIQERYELVYHEVHKKGKP